jgi:hypothetical protein
MVLLTDGITEKEKKCRDQVEEAVRLGVPIVALGIGRDWNDKLMEEIAERVAGRLISCVAPTTSRPTSSAPCSRCRPWP